MYDRYIKPIKLAAMSKQFTIFILVVVLGLFVGMSYAKTAHKARAEAVFFNQVNVSSLHVASHPDPLGRVVGGIELQTGETAIQLSHTYNPQQ